MQNHHPLIRRISIYHDVSSALIGIGVYELAIAFGFIPSAGSNALVAIILLIIGWLCMSIGFAINHTRGIGV